MKPLLLTLGIATSTTILAQIDTDNKDWFTYDLTSDILIETPAGYETDWRSNGHHFSFMFEKMWSKGRIGISGGLGFSSNNFYNNLRITTQENTGDQQYALLTDTASYRYNKVTSQYIDIPIEIRYRTTPNTKGRFFRLYAGVRVGVRVHSYSQYVTEEVDIRYGNLDDLNRFRYGLYARIGYSFISLYGYYGLTGLFQNGEFTLPDGSTAELKRAIPVSFGISFTI